MAVFVLARPALGVGEQGAANAFAIVVVGDGKIGDVAVLGVAEIILDRLQMDEADALAVIVFRDEDMRAGRLFGQVAGEVELDVFGAFAPPSPGWKLEAFDESGHQAEDEIVIVGIGEADVDIGFRIHLSFPGFNQIANRAWPSVYPHRRGLRHRGCGCVAGYG